MNNREQIKKTCHDLRNPLNSISVNADLAKLSLETSNDVNTATEAISVITQECKKLNKLIALLESDLKNT